MEEVFLYTKDSKKYFLREPCGKELSGKDDYLHLVVLTEIETQSKTVTIK